MMHLERGQRIEPLVQIADAALADSYRRAGEWMACRPGCDPCCHGVFAINMLDVQRLRNGLEQAPPAVAEAIVSRAQHARARLAADFPGDAISGQLFDAAGEQEREAQELAFEDWANDEPCPVLDPVSRTCQLYDARPLPRRTFGPPMPDEEGGLAVCELCFVAAPAEEVARCAVDAAFLTIEAGELQGLGNEYQTIIAFALTQREP